MKVDGKPGEQIGGIKTTWVPSFRAEWSLDVGLPPLWLWRLLRCSSPWAAPAMRLLPETHPQPSTLP